MRRPKKKNSDCLQSHKLQSHLKTQIRDFGRLMTSHGSSLLYNIYGVAQAISISYRDVVAGVTRNVIGNLKRSNYETARTCAYTCAYMCELSRNLTFSGFLRLHSGSRQRLHRDIAWATPYLYCTVKSYRGMSSTDQNPGFGWVLDIFLKFITCKKMIEG